MILQPFTAPSGVCGHCSGSRGMPKNIGRDLYDSSLREVDDPVAGLRCSKVGMQGCDQFLYWGSWFPSQLHLYLCIIHGSVLAVILPMSDQSHAIFSHTPPTWSLE